MHLPIPNIKQIILSQMNSSGINEMFESFNFKVSSLGGVDVYQRTFCFENFD